MGKNDSSAFEQDAPGTVEEDKAAEVQRLRQQLAQLEDTEVVEPAADAETGDAVLDTVEYEVESLDNLKIEFTRPGPTALTLLQYDMESSRKPDEMKIISLFDFMERWLLPGAFGELRTVWEVADFGVMLESSQEIVSAMGRNAQEINEDKMNRAQRRMEARAKKLAQKQG